MTDKVDLPDGAWAVLRDPKKVTERNRRPIRNLWFRVTASGVGDYLNLRGQEDADEQELLAAAKAAMGSDDWEQMDQLDDMMIAALVTEWSFDVPITVDSVLDLDGDTRDALKNVCGSMFGKVMGWTSDEEVMDPTPTTQPSNG